MSEEIIEVGEDGSFNIPSPTKPIIEQVKIIEPTEAEIEATLSQLKSKNVYETMVPGEYRIFEEDKTAVVVFVRLSAVETPLDMHFDIETCMLKVKTSLSKVYSFVLPKDKGYVKDSAVPKYFGDLLTIKISLAK